MYPIALNATCVEVDVCPKKVAVGIGMYGRAASEFSLICETIKPSGTQDLSLTNGLTQR